jgi:hypothetical protein
MLQQLARKAGIPQLLFLVGTAALASGQEPEGFFRDKGADFRGTAPETRLYWRSHVEHSHRRILEAAELAEGRAVATVLGCGVATEIPLAELARRFERLILVDLDGPSMIEALEQVPLELRPRVELRVMDVTSFVGPLMERLRQAADSGSTPAEVFDQFGSIFGELRAGEPVVLPPSDLVLSSLLLSEIPRLPLTYAGRLVRARFGIEMLDAWDGADPVFQKLVRVAIEDHAGLLASLSRTGGVVYYSDTFARGPAYQRLSDEARTEVEAAVLADFQRLGLARTAGEIAGAVGRLCVAEHPVGTEIQAYEALLAAYRRAGDDALETLLPVAELQRELAARGFAPLAPPEAWWWLSYPCAIASSPGAFLVNSLILRRTPTSD